MSADIKVSVMGSDVTDYVREVIKNSLNDEKLFPTVRLDNDTNNLEGTKKVFTLRFEGTIEIDDSQAIKIIENITIENNKKK